MICKQCGQTSDTIEDGSDWRSVADNPVATIALYECEACGYQQRQR